MFTRDLGSPTGDLKKDVATLFDYITWLTEQLDYELQKMDKQLKALKKGESTNE